MEFRSLSTGKKRRHISRSLLNARWLRGTLVEHKMACLVDKNQTAEENAMRRRVVELMLPVLVRKAEHTDGKEGKVEWESTATC